MKIKVNDKSTKQTVKVKTKCNSWKPYRDCPNPDCSWFNHAMEGMNGGGYPPSFNRSIDQ